MLVGRIYRSSFSRLSGQSIQHPRIQDAGSAVAVRGIRQQEHPLWEMAAGFHLFLKPFNGRIDLFPVLLTILALQYPDSGKLSTDVPDVDTGIDWLVYLAQYSQQCQAQSHFVVRSRLDIVENTEIMAGPNQSFYCGTL